MTVTVGTDWTYPWVPAEGDKLGSGGRITRILENTRVHPSGRLPPCETCAPTGKTTDPR